MRRALALVLVAGVGLALAAGPAHAEGAERQRRWWAHAREVLFGDLELRAEQARRVDAMIEAQLATRAQLQALGVELRAARKREDAERVAALRAERSAIRAKLQGPDEILEEIRALLDEGQRATFDMNRARLLAEGQEARRPQGRDAVPSDAARGKTE